MLPVFRYVQLVIQALEFPQGVVRPVQILAVPTAPSIETYAQLAVMGMAFRQEHALIVLHPIVFCAQLTMLTARLVEVEWVLSQEIV